MSRHNKTGRSARGPEHWTKVIRGTMEESAWRALSTTAQALYPWLKLEWHGLDFNNNGEIRLSVRQAAERLGVRPDTAAEAFRDLQRKGYIFQTEAACLGVEGAGKAPAYELTELKMPGAEGDGRKLYRQWKPGHDFPVPMTSPNNPLGSNGQKTKPCHENRDGAVTKTVTKGAHPVTKTVTACPENRDEIAVLERPTVTKTVTSLSYQSSVAKRDADRARPANTKGRGALRAVQPDATDEPRAFGDIISGLSFWRVVKTEALRVETETVRRAW